MELPRFLSFHDICCLELNILHPQFNVIVTRMYMFSTSARNKYIMKWFLKSRLVVIVKYSFQYKCCYIFKGTRTRTKAIYNSNNFFSRLQQAPLPCKTHPFSLCMHPEINPKTQS